MNIVIVKYNAGNIHSVKLALKRLGMDAVVSDHRERIEEADKVIFPGVGEANSAMAYLRKHQIDQTLQNLRQPILGICLGLQLMCRHSQENDTQALGLFDVPVVKFPPQDKVPHMGWNAVYNLKGPLFKNIGEGRFVYFVHSYYAPVTTETSAVCNYMVPFSAALQQDNFFAVQFHPEKSSDVGEQILRNFLNL